MIHECIPYQFISNTFVHIYLYFDKIKCDLRTICSLDLSPTDSRVEQEVGTNLTRNQWATNAMVATGIKEKPLTVITSKLSKMRFVQKKMNPFKFEMRVSEIEAIMKVVTNGWTRGTGAAWDCVSRRIFHHLSEFPASWERFASQNWGNFVLNSSAPYDCWMTRGGGVSHPAFVMAIYYFQSLWTNCRFAKLMQSFNWSISRVNCFLLRIKFCKINWTLKPSSLCALFVCTTLRCSWSRWYIYRDPISSRR